MSGIEPRARRARAAGVAWAMAALAAAAWAWPAPGAARVRARIELGIGNRPLDDRWLPVRYTVLESPGQDLEGRVELVNIQIGNDGEAHIRNIYSSPLSLKWNQQFPAGVTFPAQVSGRSSLVQVNVYSGRRLVDSSVVHFARQRDRGSSYLLLFGAGDEQQRLINAAWKWATVLALEPAQAPEELVYWDGVGGIVLADVSLDDFPDQSWRALLNWLGGGGTAIVTPALVRKNRGSARLGELMPVTEVSEAAAPEPARIEAFFRTRARTVKDQWGRSGGSGAGPAGRMSLLRVKAPQSVVRFSVRGIPVLAQTGRGAGSVWFCAVDPADDGPPAGPDRAPLKKAVWDVLLHKLPFPRDPSFAAAYNTDIVTPERAKVEDLTRSVLWYLAVFFLVLGPLNYAFLKKLDRREYILVTVPVISVLFAAAAYFVGYRARGGDTLVVTSQTLAGRAGDPVMAARSYLGIMAADSSPVAITVADRSGQGIGYADWVSNRSFYGQGDPVSHRFEQMGDRVSVRDLSPGKWAMAFGVAWTTWEEKGTVDGRASLDGPIVSGWVKNSLTFVLDNAQVIFQNDSVRLGRLMPGEERQWEMKVPPPQSRQSDCSSCGCGSDNMVKIGLGREASKYYNALRQFPGLVPGPLLVGFTDREGPVSVETGSRSVHLPERNLVIFRLPLLLTGGTVRVPAGASSVRELEGRGGPDDEEGYYLYDFMPRNEYTVEISMPVCLNGPVRDQSLKLVFGRDRPKPRPGRAVPQSRVIAYSLWDWSRREWIQVHAGREYEGGIEISRPERFVLLPEGLVRARAAVTDQGGGPAEPEEAGPSAMAMAKGSYPEVMREMRERREELRLKFLDVEYQGVGP